VLLILLVAGALFGRQWWQRTNEETPEDILLASGTIEAEQIDIASELGGRVVATFVDEGDQVAEGEILLQLDDALIRAQLEQAEAAADAAGAALRRAEQGGTPEEVAQATAAMSQAVAGRDGARSVWLAAQALVEDPQQAIAQYHAVQGMAGINELMLINVEQTGGTLKETSRLMWYNSANALRDAQAAYSLIYWQNRRQEQQGRELTQAEIEAEAAAWRRVEDAERLMQIGEMSHNLAQTLETQNNAIARANLRTLQLLSSELGWIASDPLMVEAEAAQAEAQYRQAQAAVEVARAALNRLLAGPSEPELDVLRAQVRQAEAAAQALRLQLQRTTLYAPADGIVLLRSIHQGELATPGVPLLTIADLETVRLTLYIPENLYGQVQLGDTVRVQVDSYPDRAFEGEVVYVSPQAEFTPKDVQTKEERVHLVYAVRVRVPNPGHLLKPGMPADAEIALDSNP
jgi:multidrug efflux pump subunit AcrA (membrane-fusion protein)